MDAVNTSDWGGVCSLCTKDVDATVFSGRTANEGVGRG